MIDYLKNSLLKIVYFTSMFALVNIVLVSSKPINADIYDIAYMDVLIIVVSAIFAFYDYTKWKRNYCEIRKAIDAGRKFDEYISDLDDSFGASLVRDIVKSKNAEIEEEVSKVKENLDEVNDYITKWIHEIKIPISVCELIADKIEDYDESGTSNVSEELRIEIERMRFLINQVLYTSRTSSFSEDLQVKEINIGNVVKSVVRQNSIFFIAKDIEVHVDNVDYNVMTDEKWVSYIIDQIINNACKYVDRGGKVYIHCTEDEKSVKLFISDNGHGICQKDIGRIFDKGFTGTSGRKTYKSTGMGLYLSKKAADRLSHELSVKSEEGKYTEFMICFYKLSDYFSVTHI